MNPLGWELKIINIGPAYMVRKKLQSLLHVERVGGIFCMEYGSIKAGKWRKV